MVGNLVNELHSRRRRRFHITHNSNLDRDLTNGLGVEPPKADNDMEITDAVRMALEKDPFVDAGQIRVATYGAVVVLRGLVPTESEREMAEADAWYVFGVDGVTNEIEVRPVPPTGSR